MNKILFSLLLFGVCGIATAAETCKSSDGVMTPDGRLTTKSCVDEHGWPTRKSIALDGLTLLEDSALYGDLAIDKSRTHWIYQSNPDAVTNCTGRVYMLDVSTKPPAVFAFGAKNTCNQFNWASWSKNGGVIVLKENVRFQYKAGRLSPPSADDEFFQGVVATPNAIKDGEVMADELAPFVVRLNTPDQILPKPR